ncbi:MAG: carbohydrate binding domain-containing protein [Kiritimatiellae bacterium]|nr:carbohydrate binding domain-containing protein [Kiritimatiellia bacterium]
MNRLMGSFCVCACCLATAGAVTVRTASLAVRLDDRDGGIRHLEVSGGTGTDAPVPFCVSNAVPLFTLAVCRTEEIPGPAGPRYLSANEAGRLSVQPESDGYVLRYQDFPVAVEQVECTVRPSREDGQIRWGMTVRMQDGWTLECTEYPKVPLALFEGRETAFVAGNTKGGVLRNLHQQKSFTYDWTQPGSLAAGFATYLVGNSGLYLGAEDAGFNPKTVRVKREDGGITLTVLRPTCEQGSSRQGFEIALGGFAGSPADWRDAADLYKRWAEKQEWCAKKLTERDDLPVWMKDAPTLVRFSGRNWFENPEQTVRWIAEYEKKFYPDTPILTAFWCWEKIAAWVTPDYFPPVPDNETFAKLVADLRTQGCHAFPWPSGYRWTLSYNRAKDGSVQYEDLEEFAKTGASHAVVTRSGTMLLERPGWLQGGTCTWMCGGDPWTHGWWNDRICAPLAKLGCEMIQADQTVGGMFRDCYKKNHGHPLGRGNWKGVAFKQQLISMAGTMKKIEPQSVVCIEEPNEWYNHLVGIQDYRDEECRAEWASVFNYLYHEYVPPFQSNPRRGNRVREAHQLADGQMPFILPTMNDLSDELLVNPSFEARVPNGHAYVGWDKVNGYAGVAWNGKAISDFDVKHGGNSSLRLENQEGEIVQVSQNFLTSGLDTTRTYRLSAWVRAETGAAHASADFCFHHADGRFIGPASGKNRMAFPIDGNGWKRLSSDFTIPVNTTYMRIMLNLTQKGRVWLDDFAFEVVQPDGTTTRVTRNRKDSYQRFMSRWITLYHTEARDWLAHGKMLHPPKLTCAQIKQGERTFPAIFHNAFRAPDGREAVVLANATYEPQQATLQWKGKTRQVTVNADDAILICK